MGRENCSDAKIMEPHTQTHTHAHTHVHSDAGVTETPGAARCTRPPLGSLCAHWGAIHDGWMQWARWICFQHRGQRTQPTIIYWGGRGHNQPSLMGVKCTCPRGSAPNRLSDWGELICN